MNLATGGCEQREDRYRVVPEWGAYRNDGLCRVVNGGGEEAVRGNEVCCGMFEGPEEYAWAHI